MPPRQVSECLGLKLSAEDVRKAKTDAYIVDRVKHALDYLGMCRSEAERQTYGTVLAAAAPERETAAQASTHRDECRSIAKVAARLGVDPGSRYRKARGDRPREVRPRALQRAMLKRAAFDEAIERAKVAPLKAGDAASSRGRLCTIVEIDEAADTCTLAFEIRGIRFVKSFTCIYKGRDAAGKSAFPKGSARLRPAPPSLTPDARETRKDEKAEAARPKVEELFNAEGARSPLQRDQVRRRLGVGIYETEQALYVYSKYSSLYALFLLRYPAHKISFSLFKSLRPWNVRRAKEETCLCKQCENFKSYMETLNSLVKVCMQC